MVAASAPALAANGTANDPFASYASRCALEWTSETRHQQRTGTLASVDLSGFTALTERLVDRGREGVEEISRIVSTIFTALIDIVVAEHGDVLSFGGDAILVWFDEVDDALCHATHQVRAARCSAALQESIRRIGVVAASCGVVRLRMSIGMHSGRLLLALVGNAEQQVVALGPVATRALALEAAARAGQVMISVDTSAALPRRWTSSSAPDQRRLRIAAVMEDSAAAARPPVPRLVGRAGATSAAAAFVPLPARAEIGHLVGEHRYVTVAFITVEAPDGHASDDPETLCSRLDEFARAMSAECARRGVTWLATDISPSSVKFIVVGGAPVNHEDDEERVLRVCRTLAEATPGLPLRVGVNSGPVYFGDLGHPMRRVLTTMGDTMNLAARLMGRSEPGQIIASRRTLDATFSDWSLEPLEPFSVKGKRALIHAAVVGSPTDRRQAGVHGRLIGRDRELAVLTEAMSRAASGAGGAVDVTASAGAGKSALVAAALDTAPAGLRVVRALGDPYHADLAYHAIAEPLRELFGVRTLASLKGVVREHAPTALPLLPLVANAFGWPAAETEASRHVAGEFRQERTMSLLGPLVSCAVEPAVLWADDAQWFDEASMKVLHVLSEYGATRGVLVVCTRRPDGVGPSLAAPTTLELRPLTAPVATEVVEHAATRPLHPHVIRAIVERAAGHPFFLRALAIAVSADDEANSGDVTLPESAERAAAAVLDRLPADARAIVRQLAVGGRSVDLAALADAAGDPSLTDPRRWRRCREVVAVHGGVATFRHGLYRDAAYVGLSAVRRRELHGRFADVLQRDTETAQPSTTSAPALALHLTQARRFADAWTVGVAAARSAAVAGAWIDANALWTQCLTVARHLDHQPQDLGSVCCEAAVACEYLGRLPEAEALLRRANRLQPTARVAVDIARVLQRQGALVGALRAARRARREAANAEDQVEAKLRIASVLEQMGRSHAAIEILMELLEEDGLSVLHRGRAALQTQLSMLSIGDDREQQFGDMAVSLLRGIDSGASLGNALNNQSLAHWYAGRLDVGGTRAQEAIDAFEAVGDMTGVTIATNNLACIWLDQGRLVECEPLLLRCLRSCEAAGDRFSAACIRSALATLALRRERAGEAALLLQGSRRDFVEMGADDLVLDADLRECEVLLWRRRSAAALALAEDCLQRSHRLSNGGLNTRWARRLRVWARSQMGDLETARREAEQLLTEADDDRSPMEQAMSLATLEALDRVEGHTTPAKRSKRRLALMRSIGLVWVPVLPVGPHIPGRPTGQPAADHPEVAAALAGSNHIDVSAAGLTAPL